MDTKEVIEILAKMQNYDSKRNVEALEIAISALEKVPVLEVENARLQKYNDTLIADNNLLRNELDAQDLLAHEDDIEFAEMEHLKKENARLREKETPKVPVKYNNFNRCPNCEEGLLPKQNFCDDCGQKLDWSSDKN